MFVKIKGIFNKKKKGPLVLESNSSKEPHFSIYTGKNPVIMSDTLATKSAQKT